ncbi:MAG: hypothetical protein FWH26_03200, partial [Oscillospiraceae bacterium]|nr:hypothetical protein [Oscillospiraceae bacterium]
PPPPLLSPPPVTPPPPPPPVIPEPPQPPCHCHCNCSCQTARRCAPRRCRRCGMLLDFSAAAENLPAMGSAACDPTAPLSDEPIPYVDAGPEGPTLPKVAYAAMQAPPPEEPEEFAVLPDTAYGSIEDFLSGNTGRGRLTVRADMAGGGALPGAAVRVTKMIGGTRYQFYEAVTDAQGETGPLTLPAPELKRSFAPPEGAVPYALYDIELGYPGAAERMYFNAMIFPDTESIQEAHLEGSAGPVNEAVYTR